tara:strand:- start:689 stop:1069 length:381 start_codon:yes stop_codon:yes gene_type:complete
MTLDHFVKENKKVIDLVKDKVPGRDDVDMYYGTLDYATARFNTVLIKLSQDKVLEQQHDKDIKECFNAIQDFYKNVQRYRFWPGITRPFIRMILHRIGTKRIPLIKKLLHKVENNNEFYHYGDDTV